MGKKNENHSFKDNDRKKPSKTTESTSQEVKKTYNNSSTSNTNSHNNTHNNNINKKPNNFKNNFTNMKNFNNKNNNKNPHQKKVSTQDILSFNQFKSTRDAEWFKRTLLKIDQVKKELDDKFLSKEKRDGKLDFIRKLQTKIKDYKEAHKNAELYKKIRFFERRKLERELKKINNKIKECEDKDDKENKDKKNSEENMKEKKERKASKASKDSNDNKDTKDIDEDKKTKNVCKELSKLLNQKEEIVDNINYVKHFPVNYKYYSLFPKNDVDNVETKIKRDKMRKKIKIYLNTKANKDRKYGATIDDMMKGDYEMEHNYKSLIEKDDFFDFDDDSEE